MFQTNTAKEIFYIFLWLAGIILLYALVYTFILEPSDGKNASSQHAYATTNTKQTTPTVSKKEIAKTVEKHIQSHTIVPTKAVSTPHVTVPVKVAKVVTVTKVEAIQKAQAEAIKEVKTSTVAKGKESVTLEKVSTAPVKEISKVSVENKVVNKPLQSTVKSSIQTVSTPSVPSAVTMPKETISIPTTPSVPTVPTVAQHETETAKVVKVPVKEAQTKEITVATEALKKELSRDEKMKLIESARELVIKEAEDARNKAMESLEK
jgi:hypothetical protein